jgi:hypothetical protein
MKRRGPFAGVEVANPARRWLPSACLVSHVLWRKDQAAVGGTYLTVGLVQAGVVTCAVTWARTKQSRQSTGRPPASVETARSSGYRTPRISTSTWMRGRLPSVAIMLSSWLKRSFLRVLHGLQRFGGFFSPLSEKNCCSPDGEDKRRATLDTVEVDVFKHRCKCFVLSFHNPCCSFCVSPFLPHDAGRGCYPDRYFRFCHHPPSDSTRRCGKDNPPLPRPVGGAFPLLTLG